jgi:hypothetical protein
MGSGLIHPLDIYMIQETLIVLQLGKSRREKNPRNQGERKILGIKEREKS